MTFGEYQAKLDRIRELAAHKSTGSPKDLARKLSVSERTLFRLIQTMKDQEIKIDFCRKANSYVLEN